MVLWIWKDSFPFSNRTSNCYHSYTKLCNFLQSSVSVDDSSQIFLRVDTLRRLTFQNCNLLVLRPSKFMSFVFDIYVQVKKRLFTPVKEGINCWTTARIVVLWQTHNNRLRTLKWFWPAPVLQCMLV